MEEFLGTWGYLGIIIWTFFEGETVVIIAGFLASQGVMDPWLVMLSGLFGSFCGDQIYYYIGRRYGTPLLARWPTLRGKIDWAFTLLRKYETAFILSFRFIYGIRNVSPFVIGISGVPRLRFLALNLAAAAIWANAFTFGGYFLGHALETYLGEYKFHALGGFVALAVVVGVVQWLRTRRQLRRMAKGAPVSPSDSDDEGDGGALALAPGATAVGGCQSSGNAAELRLQSQPG